MARPPIHAAPKRTNVIIDRSLHRDATKHAINSGYRSFSEYVGRLVVADMQRKRSSAEKAGRTLQSTEAGA